MKLPPLCVLLFWLAACPVAAQLQPGFDKQEYLDLMTVSAQVGDSAYRAALPVADGYSFRYRSPVVGLENLWELYLREDGVAVISIRGTTQRSESWLANFYAAMVPARGELTVSDEYTFSYQLAEDPRAWNSQDSTNVFAHHFHPPYIYLVERLPDDGPNNAGTMPTDEAFSGTTWELEYFPEPGSVLGDLFPEKQPRITFDAEAGRVEGNSGCNGYSAPFVLEGGKLSFGEPGPTTMMYCGEGEGYFLRTLARVNGYRIDGSANLLLQAGDATLMRFKPVE